ncbi:MAG TPA: beta-L-arabinofuranosidase domain-containing protein [Bryobacteraceae bacterium]|nr:beta-L-arabinofuranosidase domain-containing protein [Bryobacteraceae bacterium]
MRPISRREALAAIGLVAGESCRRVSAHGPTRLDLPRNPAPDLLTPLPLRDVRLGGSLGRGVDLCIRNRIFAQNPAKLVEPFRHRDEKSCWQTEFWGKWFLSAAAACEYTGDATWREHLRATTADLLSTQSADGYIGNYADRYRLKGWDVWGRKYTLLGLLASYGLDPQPRTLAGARRLADSVLAEVGPDKADIVTLGLYRGMAASSILQPMVELYRRTGDERYRDFAAYIVARWSSPEGPRLIEKAMQGVPVGQRFPPPRQWWSWENGEKAYEMMSCYAGLIDLYRATGWAQGLTAAERTAGSIRDTEINVAGSGSAAECWYGGREHQTEARERSMETCVAETWMQFCASLLRATASPLYADEIERTAYNALLGAMLPDGSSFAQYSALAGVRALGERQCGMDLNCCVANGPRGVMLIPEIAVMAGSDGPYVNLYSEGAWKLKLPSGNQCRLEMTTAYPAADSVDLLVRPDRVEAFPLRLRIPAWSEQTSVNVNGAAVRDVRPGAWASIERKWSPGDRVRIRLDLRARVLRQQDQAAIVRGPIAVARDVRLGGDIDSRVAMKPDAANRLQLTPVRPPDGIAMSFSTGGAVFCDYASAGNTWDARSRYRTWLPA